MKPVNQLPPPICHIQKQLLPLQCRIAAHPVLNALTHPEAIQYFMTQHVFCVWDFICLVKTLNGRLSPNQAPWFPTPDPDSVRLLYEILLSEETDEDPYPKTCQYGSHFEWYYNAMQACGADTVAIDHCLTLLKQGGTLDAALSHANILPSTRAFVQSTFATFAQETRIMAAYFVFGREAMIPDFFTPWLAQIKQHCILGCQKLCTYLERHITLDSDDHFPKAAQMLANLCGENSSAWAQVETAAMESLKTRLDFLDGAYAALRTSVVST